MQNGNRTIYAYLRVSTDRQDLDNQRHGVIEYARTNKLEPLHFAEDMVSGTKEWTDREIGNLLLKQAKSGDIILTAEFSRLGRSALQVLLILQEAAKRQVTIHIVKNGLVMDGSLNARMMALAFGMAAEIERDFTAQRTTEAMRQRKALLQTQGFYINSKGERKESLGRPVGSVSEEKKLDKHADKIKEWLELEVPKQKIMDRLDCCEKTLYKWMYANGLGAYIKSRKKDEKAQPVANHVHVRGKRGGGKSKTAASKA